MTENTEENTEENNGETDKPNEDIEVQLGSEGLRVKVSTDDTDESGEEMFYRVWNKVMDDIDEMDSSMLSKMTINR